MSVHVPRLYTRDIATECVRLLAWGLLELSGCMTCLDQYALQRWLLLAEHAVEKNGRSSAVRAPSISFPQRAEVECRRKLRSRRRHQICCDPVTLLTQRPLGRLSQ